MLNKLKKLAAKITLARLSLAIFRGLNIPGRIYHRKILNTFRDTSQLETHIPSKKHICVLFCYLNYEDIVKSFNSLYREETDYFIVENYSENSDKIKEFFLTKKIKGYIQFEKNISNNAFGIFLMNYYDTLKDYEYITLSDCDLLIEDKNAFFSEIFKNLDFENVLISCADFSMKNLPDVPGSENWIFPSIDNGEYLEGFTGIWLLTFKNNNLPFFYNVKSHDGSWQHKTKLLDKKWVKTRVNKAYHLTWDLYYHENEYYNFKKKNTLKLWNHSKVCDYIEII